MNNLIYKLTSPSGKVYIGKTSKSIDERIRVHLKDRQRLINKNISLPRFYSALYKYPIELWQREILLERLSVEEANIQEQLEIQKYNATNPANGYNMAMGGNGGNTGRNHEENKRKQHSMFMKQWLREHPTQAVESVKKVWENIKKDNQKYNDLRKQRSDRTPRGKEHWNYTGLWVVRHNRYETIAEATKVEQLNPWTINEYCMRCDVIFKVDCKLGKKGQTRREAGFYRIF